jgi:hypothetical protein
VRFFPGEIHRARAVLALLAGFFTERFVDPALIVVHRRLR